MSGNTPIRVLWSKAAVKAAAGDLYMLQARILDEVREIAEQAEGAFLHTVRPDGGDLVYLCLGQQEDGRWEVFIQAARYERVELRPDDGVAIAPRTISIPRPIESPDNDVFMAYDDLLD